MTARVKLQCIGQYLSSCDFRADRDISSNLVHPGIGVTELLDVLSNSCDLTAVELVADTFSVGMHSCSPEGVTLIYQLLPRDLEATANLKGNEATVTRAVHQELVAVGSTNQDEATMQALRQAGVWTTHLITASGDQVLEVLDVPYVEVVINLRKLEEPGNVQPVLLFHQCV